MATIPATLTTTHEDLGGEPEFSPIETWTTEGFKGIRHLKVAWDSRNTLISELMGSVIGLEGDGPRTLYVLPHKYPYNDSGAFVQAVGCRPYGQCEQGSGHTTTDARVGYNHAILSVEYANFGGQVIDQDQQDFIEENIEASGQFLTLSEQTVYWDVSAADPLNTMEAPQFFSALFDWAYSRKRVRKIPSAFTSLYGKVNSAALTSVSLGISFAAETLLYSSFSIRRLITTAGVQAWDLNIRFTYNSAGWNLFRKRAVQAPAAIYTAAGVQYKPYATGDFTQLVVQ